MNKQLFENLLKDLLKSNSSRKLVLAGKAGYDSVEAYKTSLETALKGFTSDPQAIKPKAEKLTIHVVDILDVSQSMTGGKIQNATKGINAGIRDLKKDESVKYTYSLCAFSSSVDFYHKQADIQTVNEVSFSARGMTALRDAIGDTLTYLKDNVKSTDKVLVNIYTDGEENASRRYSSTQIEQLTETLQAQNFTITFIGTENDVATVVKDFKIKSSNTLAYDGTAKGLGETITSTLQSRSSYAVSALAGEDVSGGFYKNIKK